MRTSTAISTRRIADILQCTLDSKGDHILAARFLNRFVPAETPWIHIDLAASNRSGGLAHIPTDFTGFGVRYTAHLLLDHDLLDSTATKCQAEQRVATLRSPCTAPSHAASAPTTGICTCATAHSLPASCHLPPVSSRAR